MGLNAPVVRNYVPNYMVWGTAAVAGVATFTENVPLFKQTFYTKIPYFGSHWEYNPDPEDVPV